MEVDGRVAVVTGGGTGIGRAVCVRLARAGAAAVVVNYSRSEDDANATVHEIESLGAKAHAHKADVSDESQVVAMIDETVTRSGTRSWVSTSKAPSSAAGRRRPSSANKEGRS